MNVLMFMFAGSDTSRESHKVLLGMLPDLPPHILDKVRSRHLQATCLLTNLRMILKRLVSGCRRV